MKTTIAVLLLSCCLCAQAPVTITAPAPGMIVSWLYPSTTDQLVAADGRATQVVQVTPKLVRVTTLSGSATADVSPLDEVRLVPGKAWRGAPRWRTVNAMRARAAALSITLDRQPWTDSAWSHQVTEAGALAVREEAHTDGIALFARHDLTSQITEMTVVLTNGAVHGTIGTRRGRLELAIGDHDLMVWQGFALPFGEVRVFRVFVGSGAAHLQMTALPEAVASLPLEPYQKAGFLPVFLPTAAPLALALAEQGIATAWAPRAPPGTWPKGGASGGGKPTLAPFPRHDVVGLLAGGVNGAALASIQEARRWPYAFHWFGPRGAHCRPQDYPEGWCGTDPARFRDFAHKPPVSDDAARGEWTTDVAHLPNAFYLPALISGDPALSWLAESLAYGSSMSGGRGLSGGGWKHYSTGAILDVPGSNVIHARGPTGAEGWVGSQERAFGWRLWQSAHAWLLTWSDGLDELHRSALEVARGHWLDAEMADPVRETARAWGFQCRPFHYVAAYTEGAGAPPVPMLSGGSSAYALAMHGIRPAVAAGASPWQNAFIEMGLAKLSIAMGDRAPDFMPALLTYATAQRATVLSWATAENPRLVPPDAYVWAVRSPANAWITTPEEFGAAYYLPGDVAPDGARVLGISTVGITTFNGNAYTVFSNPGYLALGLVNPAALKDWEARRATVLPRFPLEWSLGGL